jgi:hypothetical protein
MSIVGEQWWTLRLASLGNWQVHALNFRNTPQILNHIATVVTMEMFLKYSANSFAHTNQFIWDVWPIFRNFVHTVCIWSFLLASCLFMIDWSIPKVIGAFNRTFINYTGSYQIFKERSKWIGSCEQVNIPFA